MSPASAKFSDDGIAETKEVVQSDSSSSAYHPSRVELPNRWARVRHYIREPAAEFLGTMVLIMFGTAVDCQVVLSSSTKVSSSPKGDYLSLSFGWAIGVALGVWISGGISGGHLNPAVTIALAAFRGFSWKKVPVYIFAQCFGAFLGSLIVYGNYVGAINAYEGGSGVRTVPGTAGLFATYALPYMSNAGAFFDEFIGTALLLITVLAITDKRNSPPPPGLVPLALFIFILGIGAAFGMQTGYAINPARDFGPRLMTLVVGYGRETFDFRNQYWLWCPIIGSITGGLGGAFFYDALVFTGNESPLNKPDAYARRHHQEAANTARPIMPAGADAV